MPRDPDASRPGRPATPAADAALELALGHSEELLTGTHPDLLDRAGRLLEEVASEGGRVPAAAAWRFAVSHHRRGEYPRAVEHCLGADAEEGPGGDRARLLAVHASAAWAQGAAADSRRLTDAALRVAEECGDEGGAAVAWASQALVCALEGDRAANQYAYQRALEHARRAHDAWTLIRVHSNLGSMHNRGGRYADALDHLDQAVALAEQRPTGLLGALANINRAEALLGLGRLDEALAEAAIASDLYRSAASPMLAFALLVEAEAHRIRGSATRARVVYREALDRAAATGNAQVLVPALAGLARTTVFDDAATAAGFAKRAVEQPAALGDVRAMQGAGWVALANGDAEAAENWAERAIDEAGRRNDVPELADALELRALARRGRTAADDLAEAREIWRETGNAIRIAVNRLVAGRFDGDHGAEDAARQTLEALGVRVDAFRIAGPLQAIGPATQPEVAVRTLGSFAVIIDGEPIAASAWGSRKSRDVVKVLGSRRGRPVSREALAELLWPGVRDISGRFSVALSIVRAVLDPARRHPSDHYLIADRDQVRLNPATVSIDVVEFERVATAALAAAAADEPDAVPLLQAAASLYPASFLMDEPAQEWATEVRDELRMLSMRVKRALAERLAAAGDADQAIIWLVALLAEDPYDEPTHLELISALTRAGRYGEGRRAHRVYADRMAELDAEPRPIGE